LALRVMGISILQIAAVLHPRSFVNLATVTHEAIIPDCRHSAEPQPSTYPCTMPVS
jgi:hypothetical protein